MHAALWLLFIVLTLLLILAIWSFWRARRHDVKDIPMEERDDVLLGLLALAASELGAFLTYVLLGFKG